MPIKNQVLFRDKQDSYVELIKRGTDGTGYVWEGWDETAMPQHRIGFYFPVDQQFVADRFTKAGKLWRWED